MMLMAAQAAAATLEVTVAGVRNAEGQVRVAVCSEARFLAPACEHVGSVAARAGTVTVRIEGVQPGAWAAQAFHDENGNGKLDVNLLGMPTEGLGFSNDARMRFGPPSFNDAAFRLAPAGGQIRFTLRYY